MKTLLLSIDGGGALGIGPVNFLARVDNFYDFKVDAYAGSSVGSIIVGLLATNHDCDLCAYIFRNNLADIFQKPSWLKRLNPFAEKYENKNLKNLLVKYLGETKLKDLDCPVFITSFDFLAGRPKIFDRIGDPEVLLRDAILYSCAAPTYFPIVDGRWGDGGLVANNPTMVGITGLLSKEQVPLNEIKCLSLATNGSAWKPLKKSKMTLLGWAPKIIDTCLEGNEELAQFQASQLLGSNLCRIAPKSTEVIEMDDVEKAKEVWAPLWRDEELLNKALDFLED